VTITVFWLIKNDKLRRLWLTLASYVFYGYWGWEDNFVGVRFASLLLISTTINYFSGRLLAASGDAARRKTILIISMILNLSMIGFFKYWMLITDGINWLAGKLGIGSIELEGGMNGILPVWNIVLPIGISFFTFQAMSYTIDVYKKKVEPTSDFIEFAAYVSLFPQLIAGPIVRYIEVREILRNLPKKLSTENLNLGLFYFSIGLIKKVLIADRIAAFIDPMFRDYAQLAPLEVWVAMLGYACQILFDFGGYSLMAIGLGHLMGFVFPWNFNSPYKAVSISDFWRRWHMTLSRWLRDYLYIPLGGRDNRGVALALTMFLGGLWHGADWTFVVWGIYHAVALELHHHLKRFAWIPKNIVWARLGTFFVVLIGWVFFVTGTDKFRGGDYPPAINMSVDLLKKMFDIPNLFKPVAIEPVLIFLVVLGIIWAMLLPNAVEIVREKKLEPKTWWAVVLGILTAVCVLLLSNAGPFLYFQF